MSLVSRLMNGGFVLEGDDADTKEIEAAAKDIKATVDDDPTTETWSNTAMESLVMDIYNVDKAFHVADVIAETKVLTEGANPEVLLEGMIMSGIEKIKAAFKKFWVKIKAWFNEIKRQFQIMFMTGKDFIKKFKEEILKKNVKGFSYEGFHYTLGTGDSNVDTVINGVKSAIDVTLDWTDNPPSITSSKDFTADTFKGQKAELIKKVSGMSVSKEDDLTGTELEEKFIKNLNLGGSTDITELREYIADSYRDGENSDGKDEIKDFEKESKNDMVSFLEGFDKKIKSIEKNEKDFDKMLSTIIKELDSIKSNEVTKDDNGNQVPNADGFKYAQYASRVMSALLNVGKAACSVKQAMYKSARAQYESVLKAYLRYKPAKEGYGADDDDDDAGNGGKCEECKESLLDMAMGMVF